ncbi:MAG TPA: putative baseplate assembly protein [Solirubrobacteraceae bacterium]|nr:putative baseplate assembly protein [Solirubrobacteraceae bacterium]
MRLPEIQLDDRRFQDLVSEARLKISRSCPEWTEHNVSDPGITLIELFAWMTEMTIYRLNRVPDKLHVSLLELLGIRLDGPSAAQTTLRFRLPEVATEALTINAGTEVGTPRTATDESIVFQVDEAFEVPAAVPAAYVLQRGGQVKSIGLADGVAKPAGADQLAFANPPAVGDALCLGFEEPLGRLLIEVDVDASQARGAGVNPEDPPLRWEVSQGDNEWLEAEVLEDLTGGFNYGSGTVTLELPPRSAIQPLAGHRMHWLRCRIDDKTRHGGAATTYTQPPEIYSITAGVVGARLPATHAAQIRQEIIGVSDGTPGQTFPLHNSPLLKPDAGETLEVQDPESGDWARWELRDDFVGSTEYDRHYNLDLVSGEVEFGPAIRETDGGWTQYGSMPPKGAVLRFSKYRHGGGRMGNVTAGTLTVLKTSVAGIDTVTNPGPAVGGVDAEQLEHARERASMEIRSRYRAVTAEDFEFMAGEASPRVARAVCIPPREGGAVPLHIVPRVYPADRQLTYEELIPDEALMTEVAEYLDERRLIGTTVQLLPCRFRGLSVVVNLQASPLADTARVEEDVAHALYTYLNPLVGGNAGGRGPGWTFGRALNQGELYGIVHAVDGVEFVKILRIYETNLETGEQSSKPAGTHIVLEPDELTASGQHIVKATHRED